MMHVLIDKERCMFLAKHNNPTALTELSWLEAPDLACGVYQCDDAFGLDWLTDLELKLIYKNTTQLEYKGYGRNALLAVIHELVTRMPIKDMNAYEVHMQALRTLEPGIAYGYVKGSMEPKRISELWEPDGILVESVPGNEQRAIAAAPVAKQVQHSSGATHTAPSVAKGFQIVHKEPPKYAAPWEKKDT